jgi:nicotinamidase-related amidase
MVQKTEDNKTALIIIDIQNDYFPGGTMELASADDTAATSVSYFRRNACYPRATIFKTNSLNHKGIRLLEGK